MKVLGIDLGTTTLSGVVIEEKTGKTEESVTLEHRSFLSGRAPWEKVQSTEKLVQLALGLIEGFFAKYQDLGAIGVTGQMHGILYVDKEGKSVSPLYTWQDERARRKCFGGKSMCQLLWEESGEEIFPGYGLATHAYNLKLGLVPKQAVKLCTIGDYLVMRLTGRRAPLLHSSNGASLGFYDGKKGGFSLEALSACKIPAEILPEVTEDFACAGTYRGIPVSAAIGDNQASFLGAVQDFEHTVLVNMGTGGQVSVYSRQYFAGAGIEARPFQRGSFLLVGSSLCGGRAYSVLEHFFRAFGEEVLGVKADYYQVMAKLLKEGRSRQEETVVPLKVDTAFSGTREEPERQGRIEGITTENFTPEGLTAGVLEGMAEELYSLYQVIQEGTGIKRDLILASGNGLRKNPYLQEAVSRRFSMELRLSQQEEEAACGAARAGICAAREWESAK